MNKILLILVTCAGLLLAFGPSAQAATTLGTPGKVAGKITAIHPAHHSFTVERLDGSKREVRVSHETKIRVDGQPATFKDLAVGQKVRAAGELGPQGHILIAHRVRAKN